MPHGGTQVAGEKHRSHLPGTEIHFDRVHLGTLVKVTTENSIYWIATTSRTRRVRKAGLDWVEGVVVTTDSKTVGRFSNPIEPQVLASVKVGERLAIYPNGYTSKVQSVELV